MLHSALYLNLQCHVVRRASPLAVPVPSAPGAACQFCASAAADAARRTSQVRPALRRRRPPCRPGPPSVAMQVSSRPCERVFTMRRQATSAAANTLKTDDYHADYGTSDLTPMYYSRTASLSLRAAARRFYCACSAGTYHANAFGAALNM